MVCSKRRTKASFISYPKLNHLFMSGENKSEPNEYLIKGKVDEMVVNDIYNFIEKNVFKWITNIRFFQSIQFYFL